MQKGSKVALFLAFVCAVHLVFSLPHKYPASPVKVATIPATKNTQATRNTHMANVQINIGGPAVNVPVTTVGGGAPSLPGPASSNQFQVANQGTVLVPAQAFPASGASITANGLTLTNTGATTTLGSNTFPVLSIQALTVAAGVGYTLNETAPSNITNAFGLFDVVAPAPTAPPAPTFGTPTPTRIPVNIPALAGGATSYDLYRAPAIAGAPGTFAADALGVTPGATFSDTVSPSAGYFYRLTANNAVGSTVGAVSALITSGVLIVPGTNLKRSAILEQLRYGIHDATTQATLASGVNATNRLLSLTLAPTPVDPMDDVDASGFKVAVGTQSHQGKHTTLAVSGTIAYFDTIVACDICVCKAVVTTPGTGTTAAVKTRRYAFRPSPNTADEVDVATLDWGYGPGAAARAARAALASLSLTFARDKPVFGGSGFAQRFAENGVALAADNLVNDVPLAVVDGDDWSVYIADSLAGLVDAAKLTDCYETSIAMNNRFAPVFVGDSAQSSYNGFAEQKNDILGAINIQQDAFAQQQVMGALRAKAQKWCRIVACGPDIETVGGVTYRNRMQITYPLNFRNPRRANTENVVAGEYDLKAIYDSVSRSFLEILIDVDGTLAPNLLAAGTPLIAAQQPTALIPLEACGVSA